MGTNLVEQLQADAIQRSVPITDLLRKAKLLAVKLGSSDLATWVEREVIGYEGIPNDEIPAYRQIRGTIKWRNPHHGWVSLGLDVTMPFGNPISEIVGLLGNEAGFVMASVPDEFAESIRRELGLRVDVKFHVSCAALEGVVEGTRNAVLDWALRLGQAGVRGDGLSFSPVEAQRAQAVHINIGSIHNAVGLGAFGDHATITVTQHGGDAQLAARVLELAQQIEGQLAQSGLPAQTQELAQTTLMELRDAAVEPRPQSSRLRQGLASLQHVMEGATGNLAAAGIQALVVSILSGYH